MIAYTKMPDLVRGRARAIKNHFGRHYTIESALSDALAARGVTSMTIRADGKIHRFDASGKRRGNLCGWYVCPSHDVAVFGFWHTGEQQTVTLHGKHDLIAAERARQQAGQTRLAYEAQRRQRQALAAKLARQCWADAVPVDPGHPYLQAKAVRSHNLRQQGDTLLVPLYVEGELVNLQRIHPGGTKRFITGGRLKGAASLIGRIAGAERVYLCEGWATAATIHEAADCPVVAAMNCGNLLSVARMLCSRLAASVPITLAADNDHLTPGNPGMTKAREAALAVGATLVWPTFPCEGCPCSDFNDLAACEGRKESAA